jgi:hypothetical protein
MWEFLLKIVVKAGSKGGKSETLHVYHRAKGDIHGTASATAVSVCALPGFEERNWGVVSV